MNPLRKLAGQTVVYGLSSIGGRLLNYLLVPFYTRIFSPGDYGVISEFYAYVPFLLVLFSYGLETAYFHFSSKTGNRESFYQLCLSILFFSTLVFTSVLIFFSPSIAAAIDYAAHPEYVRYFALILAFDTLTTLPFARLRQEEKALRFAGLRLLSIGVNIFFNLFFLIGLPELAKANEGAWIYESIGRNYGVGYVFISNLIASALTFALLMHHYRVVRLPAFREVKPVLIYSWPLLIAGMAGMINETLDRVVYKYLAPDPSRALHELGIYSANYKLAMLMTLFVQTFRYAADPFFFSRASATDAVALRSKVLEIFIALACLIYLGVVLFLPLLKHFIGSAYHEGLPVVPILLLANLFLGIYLQLSLWYKIGGETRYGAVFSLLGALITLLGLFMLIPRMGYAGAAWTTLISYVFMTLLSAYFGWKKSPGSFRILQPLMLIFTAIALSFVPAVVDPEDGWKEYLLSGLLLLVFTGIGYRLLGRGAIPKSI